MIKPQFQCLFLAFTILLTAVGGAFGVVLTRVDAAQTARQNAQLSREISRLERESVHLSTVLADLERPEQLQLLLAELGSELRPVAPGRRIQLGVDSALPDLNAVRVSTTSPNARQFQLSSNQAERRPVFISE